ncbi:Squalene/phytoene synthase [Paracoccus halophilus]|uniref:Squalene/phytoene synthase n=1 Tax=Paracoccus halophilus TaxID=376733 RepID=A0A099F7C0_9RHOB|nr:squalene/phytoene synthase family protein [Paracoccus halophilus]KGJ06166.1 hypothetical protein IT41_03120 [Paracoccus halophilus]SFA45970.1 Squalene/phytoene synthase [Paracoccus halophilus]
MSLEEIAADLRDDDPDRFGASLLVPQPARARLWALYALNHELARAPLHSNEPLIAEMRVQWWIDRLEALGRGEGTGPELLESLAATWGEAAAELTDLAEARRRDCQRQPFADADAVEAYIRATACALMRHALRALAAPGGADQAAHDHALGTGLAQWLAALPQLDALGLGLGQPDPALISDLARRGLAALDRARAARRSVPGRVAPALFRGPGHVAALRLMASEGRPVAIAVSEFRRRFALGRLALTGRWWE